MNRRKLFSFFAAAPLGASASLVSEAKAAPATSAAAFWLKSPPPSRTDPYWIALFEMPNGGLRVAIWGKDYGTCYLDQVALIGPIHPAATSVEGADTVGYLMRSGRPPYLGLNRLEFELCAQLKNLGDLANWRLEASWDDPHRARALDALIARTPEGAFQIGETYRTKDGRSAEVFVILPEDKSVLDGRRLGYRVILSDGTPMMIFADMDGRTGHPKSDLLDLVHIEPIPASQPLPESESSPNSLSTRHASQ